MMLRRISKHVKDQNWFAVGLDFFIVVLGILIAFQISNWSERRQEKRVYDDAFERVISEMHTNLGAQAFIQDGVREELPIVQLAIEDLRACRTDKTAEQNIETALIPLKNPYVQLLQTDALDEFLSNDSFLKFQSPDQRELLIRLLARFVYHQQFGELQVGIMASDRRAMRHILRPGNLKYENPDDYIKEFLGENLLSPPPFRETTLTVPLSEACKDQSFLDGFLTWEDQAFRLAVTAGTVKKNIRDSLEALGRPIGAEQEQTP